MKAVVDLYVLYTFLRRLTTPFNEWKAYQEGVIDERGNILIPRSKRYTEAQRGSMTMFDNLVRNLKRLIEKLPGGKTKIASYAAALLLIKEDLHSYNIKNLEEDFQKYLKEAEDIMPEDAPANAAGGGAIAGIGVGAAGEPGFTPKMMTRYKRKNKPQANNAVS